jgi:hypothetical protein
VKERKEAVRKRKKKARETLRSLRIPHARFFSPLPHLSVVALAVVIPNLSPTFREAVQPVNLRSVIGRENQRLLGGKKKRAVSGGLHGTEEKVRREICREMCTYPSTYPSLRSPSRSPSFPLLLRGRGQRTRISRSRIHGDHVE